MPAADLLTELFEPVGGVSIRRMFGGLGVFKGGLMFGLVADDVLYFKADEATSPRYAAEGCGPFVYQAKTRDMPMPYWRAPERLYDEPEDFAEWARMAFAVALRTRKEPKGGKKTAEKASPKRKPTAKAAPKKKPVRKTAAKKK